MDEQAVEVWRNGKQVRRVYLARFLQRMSSSAKHPAPWVFVEPRDYIGSKEHLRACGDTPV